MPKGKKLTLFRRDSPTKTLCTLPRPSVARPRKKKIWGLLKRAVNALKQVVFQWTNNEMRHELGLKHWVRLENDVQKVRLENEVQKLRHFRAFQLSRKS